MKLTKLREKQFKLTHDSQLAAEACGWVKGKWATAQPVLLSTRDGRTIAHFHFGHGVEIPDIAWGADVIVCCHPELLPEELRSKHVFPYWKGVTRSSYGFRASSHCIYAEDHQFFYELKLYEQHISGFSHRMKYHENTIEEAKAFIDNMKFN